MQQQLSTVVQDTTVNTYADGYGRWRAELTFPHPLSRRDTHPSKSLTHNWAGLRRKARTAIIEELVAREWKTNETPAHARWRIRQYLPNLTMIEHVTLDDKNLWIRVVFGE